MRNRQVLLDDVLDPELMLDGSSAIANRLIDLAQEAERSGYTATARGLVNLACSVLNESAHLFH